MLNSQNTKMIEAASRTLRTIFTTEPPPSTEAWQSPQMMDGHGDAGGGEAVQASTIERLLSLSTDTSFAAADIAGKKQYPNS
jgi:hypothetical protein